MPFVGWSVGWGRAGWGGLGGGLAPQYQKRHSECPQTGRAGRGLPKMPGFGRERVR